jgi:hypothetical protein
MCEINDEEKERRREKKNTLMYYMYTSKTNQVPPPSPPPPVLQQPLVGFALLPSGKYHQLKGGKYTYTHPHQNPLSVSPKETGSHDHADEGVCNALLHIPASVSWVPDQSMD